VLCTVVNHTVVINTVFYTCKCFINHCLYGIVALELVIYLLDHIVLFLKRVRRYFVM